MYKLSGFSTVRIKLVFKLVLGALLVVLEVVLYVASISCSQAVTSGKFNSYLVGF